jgi:hypothetical protein
MSPWTQAACEVAGPGTWRRILAQRARHRMLPIRAGSASSVSGVTRPAVDGVPATNDFLQGAARAPTSPAPSPHDHVAVWRWRQRAYGQSRPDPTGTAEGIGRVSAACAGAGSERSIEPSGSVGRRPDSVLSQHTGRGCPELDLAEYSGLTEIRKTDQFLRELGFALGTRAG